MKTAQLLLGLALTSLFAGTLTAAPATSPTAVVSGVPWYDTDGKRIEAHGGGILFHEGVYYWYGENHAHGVGNKTGISCYSSRDLVQWKNEGVVFPASALPEAYRAEGVCERPKVLFNATTKKFVMWSHLDAEDYTHACAGVAVADRPTGPFTFVRAFRPLSYDYPTRRTDARGDKINERERGNTYRDMTLYMDDDGTAYVVYASEDNQTFYVSRLSADFTDIQKPAVLGKTWARLHPNTYREAPAVFKHRGKYYMFSSGTTGWSPNPALYTVADSMLGPWLPVSNPCSGPQAELTFRSQSTFVLRAPGQPEGSFIYMGDRWIGDALEQSTYVWLPFVVGPKGEIALENYDRWDPSFVFQPVQGSLEAPKLVLETGTKPMLTWAPVKGAAAYRIFRNGTQLAFTADTSFAVPPAIPGLSYHYTVVAAHPTGKSSPASNVATLKLPGQGPVFLDAVHEDHAVQGWGVFARHDPSMPPINTRGRTFVRGLDTHSHSEITYNLGGIYRRFTAATARLHESGTEKVQFRVYGDGRLLYLGNLVTGQSPIEDIDIQVEGVLSLKLVVADGGDSDANDGAFWADPRIE